MEFVDNSKAVKRELERAAIRGLIKASLLVEGQAVLLAPVDKGGLRDSIGYKVDESELVAPLDKSTFSISLHIIISLIRLYAIFRQLSSIM